MRAEWKVNTIRRLSLLAAPELAIRPIFRNISTVPSLENPHRRIPRRIIFEEDILIADSADERVLRIPIDGGVILGAVVIRWKPNVVLIRAVRVRPVAAEQEGVVRPWGEFFFLEEVVDVVAAFCIVDHDAHAD